MKVHRNILNVDPIHQLQRKKNLHLLPLNQVDSLKLAPLLPYQKTSSDIESDTKKRSRSFIRPVLRSAVPDSQLMSLARRPVQSGNGKKSFEKTES